MTWQATLLSLRRAQRRGNSNSKSVRSTHQLFTIHFSLFHIHYIKFGSSCTRRAGSSAQPLATKEPYGCGVPLAGARPTARVRTTDRRARPLGVPTAQAADGEDERVCTNLVVPARGTPGTASPTGSIETACTRRAGASAQPFARNERYGCGVPLAGARPTERVR